MTFIPFAAGQRVTAGQLNGNSAQLLGSASLTGAAASVSLAVPSGYSRLQVYFSGKSTNASAASSAQVQFNGDTGANYNYIFTQSNNGTTTTSDNTGKTSIVAATLAGATSTTNYGGAGNFTVDNAGGGTFFPTVAGVGSAFVTTTNMYNGIYSGNWLSTAAITSIQLSLSTGSWAANSSFSVYGVA